MELTYNGQTMSPYRWAKVVGINETTIRIRKEKGWDDEKTLATPVTKPFSKNDAELLLNETPQDKLPPEILKLVLKYQKASDGYRVAKKFGELIREHYRKEFDLWFTKTYRT